MPVYGDEDLMGRLLPSRQIESITVCGVREALYIDPEACIPEAQKTFKQISEQLQSSLSSWARHWLN